MITGPVICLWGTPTGLDLNDSHIRIDTRPQRVASRPLRRLVSNFSFGKYIKYGGCSEII